MPRYKKNQEHKTFKLQVNAQGRIVIPAPMRRALGIRPGSVIQGKIENGKVVLIKEEDVEVDNEFLKAEKELWEEHEKIKKSRKTKVNLVHELLARRKKEARLEAAKRARVIERLRGGQ